MLLNVACDSSAIMCGGMFRIRATSWMERVSLCISWAATGLTDNCLYFIPYSSKGVPKLPSEAALKCSMNLL